MNLRGKNRIAVSAGLALVTLLVFLPALRSEFIDYDDPFYVMNNRHVLRGLTWGNLRWAFTNLDAGFWHPLTWLSYMLDRQLFGPGPGGFHFTNVLLHAASTVLLFEALRRMTGALWRSALVATLFALHPLHVESVAWVSERKDVLSTLFWMLTLLMYERYVRKTRCEPPTPVSVAWSSGSYGLVMLCFVGGLMSKTMVVTLPVVLLLLDAWPLGRIDLNCRPFPRSQGLRLISEKIPLFVLGGLSVLVTIHAERGVGALGSTADYPLMHRVANAAVSYMRYLAQTVWPANQAVYYPFPQSLLLWPGIGAGILVLTGSATAIRAARQRCYVATGWFWYVLTLLPVIGLLQIGGHARADRYTYVPLIGVFIALAWGAGEAAARGRLAKGIAVAVAGLAVAACALGTRVQLRHWQNSESLFRQELKVMPDCDLAYYNMGCYQDRKGNMDEAMKCYRRAIELNRASFDAYNNLGAAFGRKRNPDEAIRNYLTALQLAPNNVDILNNLGVALAGVGKLDEAIPLFLKAADLAPDGPKTQNNLGNAMAARGRTTEAIAYYRKALELDPDYAEAHNNLGNALLNMGNLDEAIAQYRKALLINSNYVRADYDLGIAFMRRGKPEAAVEAFTAGLRLEPDNPDLHNNLGAALAAMGNWDEAIRHYAEALRLAPGNAGVANNLGNAWLGKGRADQAMENFLKALQINPDFAEAHANLGTALVQLGRTNEAIAQLTEALRLKPDYAQARQQLRALGAPVPDSNP